MDKHGLSRDCGGKMEKQMDKSNLMDDFRDLTYREQNGRYLIE